MNWVEYSYTNLKENVEVKIRKSNRTLDTLIVVLVMAIIGLIIKDCK